jgi:hypothetical protein
MRVVVLAALASAFVVVLSGGTARAQATAGTPPVASVAPPAPAAAAPEKAWSFSASAYTYVLPDDPDYVQPTIAADHGWLHLEGRFNYEDLDTGSAWFGYNFSVGETITLEFTPMVGAVFGNTTGIAPGYKGSLGWGKLDLSSETEYVIDTGSSADSFLYTWSELGLTPVDWCRFGLVVQRSKAYKTEFDIQRGFFAGISYNRVDVTAYVFNPDASRPIIVVGVGVSF